MCTIQARTPAGIIKCTFTTKLPNNKEEALKIAQDPYFPCNTYIALKALGNNICMVNDAEAFARNSKRKKDTKRRLRQKKYNCICNTYKNDSTPKASRTAISDSISTFPADNITSVDGTSETLPAKPDFNSSPSKANVTFINLDLLSEMPRFDTKTIMALCGVMQKFEDLHCRQTAVTKNILNRKSVERDTAEISSTHMAPCETTVSPKEEKIPAKPQPLPTKEEQNSLDGPEKECTKPKASTGEGTIKKNIVMAVNSVSKREHQHKTKINSVKQIIEKYQSLKMPLKSQETIINGLSNAENKPNQIAIPFRKENANEYKARRVTLQPNIPEENAVSIFTGNTRIGKIQITVTAIQKELKMNRDLKGKQLVVKSSGIENIENSGGENITELCQSSETTVKNSSTKATNKNTNNNAKSKAFDDNSEYKYQSDSKSSSDSITNTLMNHLSAPTALVNKNNKSEDFATPAEDAARNACKLCKRSYPVVYNTGPGLLGYLPVISHEVIISNPDISKKESNSFIRKDHYFPLNEAAKFKTEEHEIPRSASSLLDNQMRNKQMTQEATNSAEVGDVDAKQKLVSKSEVPQKNASRKKNKRKGKK